LTKKLLAPSILSADFTKLGDQIRQAEEAGADLIHVDVMDGHFVPNITIGPAVIKNIKKATNLPLDVHLMIENPEYFIDDFINAGADYLSIHLEACQHLHRVIYMIKSKNQVKVGVALNPHTAATNLVNILEDLDFILIMSVNPGFGGQKFIEKTTSKISFIKKMIVEKGLKTKIEVDGGIDKTNIAKVVQAGADIIVAGNAVFANGDIKQSVDDLKSKITG
jgi:ribulose-phosphate 3-epimerase